jgi:hypothetical protein
MSSLTAALPKADPAGRAPVSRHGRPNARADAKLLAGAKRAALYRRARRIRRSVAALAVALFLAAFAGIYVQLATGHDPALVAAAQRRATTAQLTSGTSSKKTAAKTAKTSQAADAAKGSAATKATTATKTTTTTGSSSTSSSEGPQSSSSPSAVTTSQS